MFAPAYIELSKVFAKQKEWEKARQMAYRAADLAPTRAGYHLNLARILARLGQKDEARRIAESVALRWTGADRSEAIDLADELAGNPDGTRTDILQEPRASLSPQSAIARGVIQAVVCGPPSLKVMVQANGRLLEFRAASPFGSGFADTIWYGRDHFNMCHLEGNPVVVRYTPVTDGYAGTIVALEIRDQPWEFLAEKTASAP